MDYYNSPRWSQEIADCSMPMTFDTYSNCSYGCLYCFSQYQRAVGPARESYIDKKVKWVNIAHIKKMFLEPDSSQFGEYIKRKMVFQWGGLSDQFDNFEKKFGVTLELLKFFKEINYPICFSTKATWWLKDERYTELFRDNKNWNVKFSIITLDEQKATRMERGVDSPRDRINAIEKLTKLNAGGATLRLRPFIFGLSNPTHLQLIKDSRSAGATAISTEFFCFEQRSPTLAKHLPLFNLICGMDIKAFYKKYSCSSGYMRLNRNIKRNIINEMQELCDKIGMRFYVSDAHFKERCANGSCCGLSPEFNYSRGQFCQALLIAREKGSVKFQDIEGYMGHLENFNITRANAFNMNTVEKSAKLNGLSAKGYMRYLWNTPMAGQSPYKLFEGILVPKEKDSNGDFVYYFNKERE